MSRLSRRLRRIEKALEVDHPEPRHQQLADERVPVDIFNASVLTELVDAGFVEVVGRDKAERIELGTQLAYLEGTVLGQLPREGVIRVKSVSSVRQT